MWVTVEDPILSREGGKFPLQKVFQSKVTESFLNFDKQLIMVISVSG
jgi:hypothetical protein